MGWVNKRCWLWDRSGFCRIGCSPKMDGWQHVVKYKIELSQVLVSEGEDVEDNEDELEFEKGKEISSKMTSLETMSLL